MILTVNLSNDEKAVVCECINRVKRPQLDEVNFDSLKWLKFNYVKQVLEYCINNLIKEENKEEVRQIVAKLTGSDNRFSI